MAGSPIWNWYQENQGLKEPQKISILPYSLDSKYIQSYKCLLPKPESEAWVVFVAIPH